MRNVAGIIHGSLVRKPERMEKIWPLRSDKKQDIEMFEQPNQEWWDKMMAAQDKIDKQIKNN